MKIAFTILFILGLLSCKNPGPQDEAKPSNQAQEVDQTELESIITNPSEWIIGTWQDENSTMEYKEDGNWYGKWASGTELTGKYEVIEDSLFMGFSYRPEPKMKYIIFKKTQDSFSILSYNDREVFNKKRVKDVLD